MCAKVAKQFEIREIKKGLKMLIIIRGYRSWKFRCWLGGRIIALGAAVIGIPAKIEIYDAVEDV